MIVTLTSTPHIVGVDGVPCRLWFGHSDDGVAVVALILWTVVLEGQEPRDIGDLAEQAPTREMVALLSEYLPSRGAKAEGGGG